MPPSERGERGGSRGPKAASAPKVKRPRGWNTWAPSEKWQDDPIIDAGECLRLRQVPCVLHGGTAGPHAGVRQGSPIMGAGAGVSKPQQPLST